MHRIAVLAVMLSASVVRADEHDPLDAHVPGNEPDGYASGGGIIGTSQGYISNGIVFDAGSRLGSSLLFGRAMGQAGTLHRSDEPGRGNFVEGRVGAEVRSCTYGGMACGSAGVDVGIRRADFTHVSFAPGERRETPENLDALVAVPRITLDAGGRIRFRVSVELPVSMRNGDSASPTVVTRSTMTAPDTSDHQFTAGLTISAALAVGF
jgi:hypothetical protein